MTDKESGYASGMPEKILARLAESNTTADPYTVCRDYLINLQWSGSKALEQIQLIRVGTPMQKAAALEYIGASQGTKRYQGTVFSWIKELRSQIDHMAFGRKLAAQTEEKKGKE